MGSEKFFFTDGRYELEAKEVISSADIIVTNNLYGEANRLLKSLNIDTLIYDPNDWTIFSFDILRNNLDIQFIQEVNFSHKRRIVKRDDEIKLLSKASKIGRDAFAKFADEVDRAGIGQSDFRLTYLAKSILSNYGENDLSFEPIVA